VLPRVENAVELRAAIDDAAVWPRVARLIAARHGVSLDGLVQPESSFPVLVHRRHVVKLVPARWRAKLDAERTMLVLARGALPVPEIVAEGELETWSYLVMTRMEGRPASRVMKSAGDDQRRAILRAVGEVIARLHALPVPAGLATDWAAFVRDTASSCAERHARGGASPTWTAAIGERLATELAALASPGAVVPLHADIHAEHVLFDHDSKLTALLDFGDAVAGDPAYELVTPATFLVRGRPELMAALFEGYGRPLTPDLRRRCMAYQLLHRFSDLRRDTELLVAARPVATLDLALEALWPG
jgi:hygromycin-B 7''-O-kinase